MLLVLYYLWWHREVRKMHRSPSGQVSVDLLLDFLQLCETSGFIELRLPLEDLKSKVLNHCTASHLSYSFRHTGLFFSFFSSICYGVPSSKANPDQHHHGLVPAVQRRRHVWIQATHVSQTLSPRSHPSPHPLLLGFLGAIHLVIMGRVYPSPSSLMSQRQS